MFELCFDAAAVSLDLEDRDVDNQLDMPTTRSSQDRRAPLTRPTVAVIVINFNGRAVLSECVRSILDQDYADLDVIIADNGSQDGSAELPVLASPRLRVLKFGENLGFAEANNRAIRQCSAELIALVNNDTVLAADWVSAMVAALQAKPRAGAAAGQTLQALDPTKIDTAGFAFYSCCSAYGWSGRAAGSIDPQRHRPFGPVASAAMYRRRALDDVGLFHPEYFCYYEDTDLAVRLVLFGYETAYAHDARAWHLGSHTGQRHSSFHVYHLRRNAEYLYWVDMVGSNVFWHLPFHALHELLAFAAAVRRGQASTVLRAKRDAILSVAFIARERSALAKRLRTRADLADPRKRLSSKMRIGLPFERVWRRAP